MIGWALLSAFLSIGSCGQYAVGAEDRQYASSFENGDRIWWKQLAPDERSMCMFYRGSWETIASTADLKGEVRVKDKADAVSLARFTSQIRLFNDPSLQPVREIMSRSEVLRSSGYILRDFGELARTGESGADGIVDDDWFASNRLHEPVVTALEHGFKVDRFVLRAGYPVSAWEVAEFVGPDGSYRRCYIRELSLSLPGAALRTFRRIE